MLLFVGLVFREQTNTGSEDLIAEGVEFDCQGSTHIVRAKREVIIAAGYVFRDDA